MRTCVACQQQFEIYDEDSVFYKKFDVPEPKTCPDCRLVRRLMERNARNLYYRTCDLTKKQTLSQYHAAQKFPVYSPVAWWSDDWDAIDYGRDFDFSRPFFEQFLELKNKVPHLALFNTEGTMENSDFNNCTAYLKNCYLIAESDYCEDCYYSNLLKKCTNIVDCSICYDDELCYECVDCQNCYNLRYSKDCKQCRDSFFLKNCISCKDCIGCINLRHKQFYIFNEKRTKEEYERQKKEFALDTHDGIENLRKKSYDFWKTQPHKATISEHNQESSGDHLYDSKNAFHCFDSKDLEDCRYCAKLSLGVKSSMDYNSWGNKCELVYQTSSTGDNLYNVRFCVNCQTNMRNCTYCYECFSCDNCFGCVSLKKQEFCILNKKYSKADYERMRGRIIEHMKKTSEWGEFFPIKICPFGYNESIAMDAFPLTKKEAIKKGYTWKEEEKPVIKSRNTPTCICGKQFKLIGQELRFYKQQGIPCPQKCPTCRHKARMKLRNPLKLWVRICAKCKTEVQTSYAPDRPEIIYCEKCYLKAVY